MAALARPAHHWHAPRAAWAAPRIVGRWLAMYGDAHGWMSAALAIVMVIGTVVLVALGKPVPAELTSGLLLVFGFFFGRAFQLPSPPATPPAEPPRPQLIIPNRPDPAPPAGGGHAAD